MFKRMKLGTKIVTGFSSLLAIALALGGLSIWRMNEVKGESTKLATEYVPEVAVANELERQSLLTMFAMRGYGLSAEEKYLAEGRERLDAVDRSLKEASALAERSVNLVKLKGQVDEVEGAVAEYKRLVEETVARNEAMDANRQALDTAAAAYMKNASEFLSHQSEMMAEELGGGSGHGTDRNPSGHTGEYHATGGRVTPIVARPCPAGDQVIEELQAGNLRFVSGELTNPNSDQNRRTETVTGGQHPRVTVLACSDSRVPVETLFDQGIGDVFPVRVAGNVCAVDELGSLEYGVEHLETPLLVVLGHTHCGAVTAATTGAAVHGSIPALLANLRPAVDRARQSAGHLHGDALVETGVRENVWYSIEQVLTRSKAIQDRARAGRVKVVGAIYDLESGRVDWLGSHPNQGQLLATAVSEPVHVDAQASAATGDASQRLERLEKIILVNDIIDLGNETRVACFKSQALRDPKLIEAANKNFDAIGDKFAALRKITRLREDLEHIDQIEEAAGAYQSAMNDLLANWMALQDISTRRNDAATVVLAGAQTTAQAGLDQTSEIANGAMTSLSTASTVMTVGLGIALVVGIVLAILITRSITKPINRIITSLNEGADQVNDAAGQVSSASQQLAEGASEQASSLEETSSALEQMAAMTRTNAENAKQADELSSKAKNAAQSGDHTMEQLNLAMTAINESSGKISKIIKVIEEIAFQTNLLALNAAVEAARAGEHGKGFAVVADEVRNLAQRAAEAARETTGLIEDSVNKAREGAEVAGEVGKALGAIVADVTKVTDLVNGITRASEEQAQGVEQVNTAVSQMDKVTQQNASGAEESASAAEELSAQAAAVKGMVDELAQMVGGSRAQHVLGAVHASGPGASRSNGRGIKKSLNLRTFNGKKAHLSAGNGAERFNLSDESPGKARSEVPATLEDPALSTF